MRYFTHIAKDYAVKNRYCAAVQIEQIEILKQKLRVAEKALNDIVRWNDDLEDEWGDPGERANAALEKIMIIDGF